VSNLHYSIGNEELNELFAQVGTVASCKVLWDKEGRSTGEAIVTYENEQDADKAIQEYNEAELDGQVLSVKYDNEGNPRVIKNKNFKTRD